MLQRTCPVHSVASMRPHAASLYALVTAFSIAILYGATYQQFRFFSLAAPGGAIDAVEYVKISMADPTVDLDGPHHYRWVTPAAARLILPAITRLAPDPELGARLSFYLVNFTISTATCLLLFALLLDSLGDGRRFRSLFRTACTMPILCFRS